MDQAFGGRTKREDRILKTGKILPPKYVWIGAAKYELVFDNLKAEMNPDGMSYRGQIRYETAKIIIDEGLDPGQLATTFLHEVLHGIWEHSTLRDMKRTTEEGIVNGFSLGLTNFWVDNPKAFRWWMSLLQRVKK